MLTKKNQDGLPPANSELAGRLQHGRASMMEARVDVPTDTQNKKADLAYTFLDRNKH